MNTNKSQSTPIPNVELSSVGTEMTAEQVQEHLKSGQPLTSVTISGKVNLQGNFPNEIKLVGCAAKQLQIHASQLGSNLTFAKCELKRARFENLVVEGDLDLRGCDLYRVDFIKCEIKGKVRLDLVSSFQAIRFTQCKFHGQFRLWDGRFHDWVEFTKCQFHDKADFRNFHADEGFVAKDCQFEDDMLFRGSTVCKKLEFSGSRFDAITDFSKAKLRDVTYLEDIEQGPNHRFAFQNALFNRVLIRSSQLKGRLNSEETGEFLIAAEEYGLLKQNFQNLNRYDEEDLAFYRFKVNKRRSRKTSWLRPWTKLTTFLECLFLDLGCGYGAKPFRAVSSALLLMTVFAAIYALEIDRFDEITPPIADLAVDHPANRGLFGVVTSVSVFTAGFTGEHLKNAHGWVLIPLAIEALLGTLLWGLFIVAFSRKVIR